MPFESNTTVARDSAKPPWDSSVPKGAILGPAAGTATNHQLTAATVEDWKKRNGYHWTKRVFSINPRLPVTGSVGGALELFRQALIGTGEWVENEDCNSTVWDMKFGLKGSDIGVPTSVLAGKTFNHFFTRERLCNFYGHVGDLTTKLGLHKSLNRFLNPQRASLYQTATFDLSDKRAVTRFIFFYQRQFCKSILLKFMESAAANRLDPVKVPVRPQETSDSTVQELTSESSGGREASGKATSPRPKSQSPLAKLALQQQLQPRLGDPCGPAPADKHRSIAGAACSGGISESLRPSDTSHFEIRASSGSSKW